MRIPRVYLDQRLRTGETVALDKGTAHHLSHVLRLRSGDPLQVFNGDGWDWHATLESTIKRQVSVRIGEPAYQERAAPLRLHLLLGVSKGERMDFAIQKAVELGVDRITPLQTQRTLVKFDQSRLSRRSDHWRGILINACEQAARSRIPDLAIVTELRVALQTPPAAGILLDPTAENTLVDVAPPARDLALLVGPEGGLTDDERHAAEASGFRPVRLGPRILRTETAPLAALAAVQTLWGDFR